MSLLQAAIPPSRQTTTIESDTLAFPAPRALVPLKESSAIGGVDLVCINAGTCPFQDSVSVQTVSAQTSGRVPTPHVLGGSSGPSPVQFFSTPLSKHWSTPQSTPPLNGLVPPTLSGTAAPTAANADRSDSPDGLATVAYALSRPCKPVPEERQSQTADYTAALPDALARLCKRASEEGAGQTADYSPALPHVLSSLCRRTSEEGQIQIADHTASGCAGSEHCTALQHAISNSASCTTHSSNHSSSLCIRRPHPAGVGSNTRLVTHPGHTTGQQYTEEFTSGLAQTGTGTPTPVKAAEAAIMEVAVPQTSHEVQLDVVKKRQQPLTDVSAAVEPVQGSMSFEVSPSLLASHMPGSDTVNSALQAQNQSQQSTSMAQAESTVLGTHLAGLATRPVLAELHISNLLTGTNGMAGPVVKHELTGMGEVPSDGMPRSDCVVKGGGQWQDRAAFLQMSRTVPVEQSQVMVYQLYVRQQIDSK